MNYAYTAIDGRGAKRTGTISAESPSEARDQLRDDGLYATEITEDAGARKAGASGGSRVASRGGGSRGGQLKLMSLFARELSLLVSSGTPMVDALAAVEKQTADDSWRAVVADIRAQVEEGESLSAALGRHPKSFDPIARSMVAAGEAGGNLAGMLNRMSALVRQQIKIRSNVLGAMVYPAVLIFVCTAVLISMIIFVLPRFAGMFESLDAELPASTAVMMDLSAFIRGYWWAIVPSFIGVLVLVFFWSKTTRGRWSVSAAMLHAPQIGSITRSLATARIARLLGVLVESRVPMLEAIEHTRKSTTNPHYARMLAAAEDAVLAGDTVSGAFDQEGLMPPAVIEAIRNGEKSGQLGKVLLGLAEHLDEDNEVLIRSLSSIIEPLILVGMGVLVAFVALSMFLPLFDLTAAAAGGGP